MFNKDLKGILSQIKQTESFLSRNYLTKRPYMSDLTVIDNIATIQEKTSISRVNLKSSIKYFHLFMFSLDMIKPTKSFIENRPITSADKIVTYSRLF